MVSTLSRITTLLFAAAVLLIGHGLQLTMLPLHALAAGWSSTAIGWTGSFYFIGFVTGCIVLPATVSRVGHIRSFMVMAAVATVALLLAGLFVDVGLWLVFRFASGFALSGLYMVIESWLTDVTPNEQRGRVLSIYLFVTLLGMAVGQLLISAGSPEDLRLFVIAAIMISIAIVPIGLTHVSSPHPIPGVRFTPRTLLRASRVAVVSVILAGMVVGSFWALGPVVARSYGLEQSAIGLLMSLGVVGGAVAQIPIGRFSDSIDRRIVIAAVSLVGVAVCVLAFMIADASTTALYAAFLLLGAVAMPLYALCIAHATDRTELMLIEVASGMLLAHSAGSIVGPIVVAPLMGSSRPGMFFLFSAVCLAISAIFTIYRYSVVERPLPHDASATLLPKTTQAIAELADRDLRL
ncbi:MAG: MFS transporter [Gammaproteobacteria bacterium]|nr:MFS transporter [Gammaproteobacteria bacterium]